MENISKEKELEELEFDELLKKFAEGDDMGVESEEYPDGEIELNANLTIQVEILRPIENPREALNSLVGCANIKHRMAELVAITTYNGIREYHFPTIKSHRVSLHSIFLGRPGTGKTTVCKIFGSLLHEAGILSKGHVVVCDRGTFVGTLWGDEERAVKALIEKARGGVLMIDEAYLLNSPNPNDPGHFILPLLMDILADESRRDIAVVLCGYKTPMMKLLDTNPGLRSRFPNIFEFPDFSVNELVEIALRRVKDYRYHFTDTALSKFRSQLSSAYQQRDPETWGNARYVANVLERIYIQHAIRCTDSDFQDPRSLLRLTTDDIVPFEVPKPRARVGF